MSSRPEIDPDEVESYEPDFTLIMSVPNESVADRLEQLTAASTAHRFKESTE